LPAGVVRVEGEFEVGAAVKIADASGRELARGLVNYCSSDIVRIMGHKSREITAILGHKDFDEVVHRNNLVVL
jgi:glutamate 5-kinase